MPELPESSPFVPPGRTQIQTYIYPRPLPNYLDFSEAVPSVRFLDELLEPLVEVLNERYLTGCRFRYFPRGRNHWGDAQILLPYDIAGFDQSLQAVATLVRSSNSSLLQFSLIKRTVWKGHDRCDRRLVVEYTGTDRDAEPVVRLVADLVDLLGDPGSLAELDLNKEDWR